MFSILSFYDEYYTQQDIDNWWILHYIEKVSYFMIFVSISIYHLVDEKKDLMNFSKIQFRKSLVFRKNDYQISYRDKWNIAKDNKGIFSLVDNVMWLRYVIKKVIISGLFLKMSPIITSISSYVIFRKYKIIQYLIWRNCWNIRDLILDSLFLNYLRNRRIIKLTDFYSTKAVFEKRLII